MSVDGDGVRVALLESREDAVGPVETLLNDCGPSDADAPSVPPFDVRAAGRLSEGLSHVRRETPDVVLLGADLPDSPGLDGLDDVLDSVPGVPVVVLTDLDGREIGTRAIERGAREHLVTDDLSADDLTAVVRAAAGHVRPTALLDSVNRFARAARGAESATALAERTVDAVRSDLHLPLAAVVRYAGRDDGFETAARSPLAAATLGRLSIREDGGSAIWRVFVEDEPARIEPDAAEFGDALAERSVTEVVAVPLGGHGILLAGSTSPDGAGTARREAVEAVGETAREALDRLDRERTIEAREAELDSRSERLREVNRIDALIRELTTAIVTATTRTEIERVVCRRLADAEPYGFAWIGEHDRAKEEVTPRTGARSGGVRPDAAAMTGEDTISDPELVRRAARTGEPQIRNVFDEPPLEPWRREALERGYRSVIAAPISYRGTIYGVLTVYADEPDAFTSREESTITRITETVAHAINALETKRSLTSDSLVELEFEIADPDVFPVRLTAETGGTFELAAVESRSDASLTVFFTAENVRPERVSAVAADADASLTHIAEYEGTSTFICQPDEPSFFSSVIDQGALVSAFVADGGHGRVRVQLPKAANVHSFVEMLQTRYRDAELAARRERDQPIQTRHGFRAEFERSLTDRQLEVLRVAYFSGYFDWPRGRTGEEIADSLDVSQPTINRHLRISQQKLCRLLFDD